MYLTRCGAIVSITGRSRMSRMPGLGVIDGIAQMPGTTWRADGRSHADGRESGLDIVGVAPEEPPRPKRTKHRHGMIDGYEP